MRYITLLLVSAWLLNACTKALPGNGADSKLILDSVKINTTDTLPLLIGKDSLLPVTLAPLNASNTRIVWSSSDVTVASVDDKGRVKSLAEGTAKISATSADGGYRIASVVVKAITKVINVTAITIKATSVSIFEGDTLQLKGVIAPSDATYTTLKWSSSNTAVATVSSTGVLTSVSKGTVTITAAAIDGSNSTGTVSIEVKEVVPVTAITVNDIFSEAMAIGEKRALSLTLTPSNASAQALQYSSSNTAVATVSADGVVTAVALGTAVITIETKDGKGVKATAAISVEEGKISDTFIYTSAWVIATNNSFPGIAYKTEGGLFVGTMGVNTSAVYRGDFQRTNGVTVHAGKYPIIAFKFNRPTGTAGNMVLDTDNGSYLNGNNKVTTVTGKDGVQVHYADFAGGTFGASSYVFSTAAATTLKTFQMKIADFKFTADQLATGNNTYKVYWVKSFKTKDELLAYINK